METDNQQQACFICLGDETTDRSLGPLGHHCACKFLVSHKQCLLRWQLQQAGRAESRQCRFCGAQLADWKAAIASTVDTTVGDAPAVMAVVFQGKTIKVPVASGPNGIEEFKKTVCSLFNLPSGTEFEVTFECKSPVFGDRLHLKGFDCFEAASYCAAVSAAKRAQHKKARAEAAGSRNNNAAGSSQGNATRPTTSDGKDPAASEVADSPRPRLPTPFSLPGHQSHLQQSHASASDAPAGSTPATTSSMWSAGSTTVPARQPSCGPALFMHKLRASMRGRNNSNTSRQASLAAEAQQDTATSPAASLSSSQRTFDSDQSGSASARSSTEQNSIPSLLSSEPPSAHVVDASQRGAHDNMHGGVQKSNSGQGLNALASFFRRVR